MDIQRGPLLTWAYYCQGKSMEELRQSLLLTTLELETTRLKAQEELQIRDEQLSHLKDLLTRAMREKEEAEEKCHRLILENLLIQQNQHQQLQVQQQQQQQQQYNQTAPISGISSIEDEPIRGLDSNNGFSSSDCEESIVSSPVIDPIQPPQQEPPVQEPTLPLVPERPLPEKGKLLQAVMKAGPLLQTLLLAGPLPQWRHPPPPLDSYQIPPPPPLTLSAPPPPPIHVIHQDSLVNIDNCGRVDRKRGLCEGSESPTESKYQRLVLH